jgi:microcystin-dependent protein
MPDEYVLKEYEGGTVPTTLSALISAGATSIAITSGSSFPNGATAPFVVVIDRGLVAEEKVLVDTRASNTLTVQQRGYDGTVAQAHAAGATINHCVDAYTLKQVNAMANAMTSQYDLVYRGAAPQSFERIAVGSNGHLLGVTAGVPGFAALGLANIPDGLITAAKLIAAVQNLLVPAGTVSSTIAASAPTGWLFHNQSVDNADVTYPDLWALAPASWKSGATLIIPNLTDRDLMQAGTTALGAVGGANSRTIASANLPTHTHAVDHDHGSVDSGNVSSDHTHSGTTADTQPQSGQGSGVGGNAGFVTSVSLSAVQSSANHVPHNHTFTTGGISANHMHTVDLPNFTGASGNGGFANAALTTTPSHLAVNIMIKAH